jgi:hypothetical protein
MTCLACKCSPQRSCLVSVRELQASAQRQAQLEMLAEEIESSRRLSARSSEMLEDEMEAAQGRSRGDREEMEAVQGALVTRAAPPDTAARDSSGSSSRFAQQTLQVFVPLAHRLGMWYFKGELEQRCFALTKPRDFERISSEVRAMECHGVLHRVPT